MDSRNGNVMVGVTIVGLIAAVIGSFVLFRNYYLPRIATPDVNKANTPLLGGVPTATTVAIPNSVPSSSLATHGAQKANGRQIDFTVNGLTDSVTVMADSQMQFSWTANGFERCGVPPLPSWSVSGQISTSGVAVVPAPPPRAASYEYQIVCVNSNGSESVDTVSVAVVPASNVTPSLSVTLAPSSTFEDPLLLRAKAASLLAGRDFTQTVAAFGLAVATSEEITITSISLRANEDLVNGLPLSNLKLYLLRNDAAELGLSDQFFGETILGSVVSGRTYTFTGSIAVPADGHPDLVILASVKSAKAGSYTAPVTLTDMVGNALTGGSSTILFSGYLDGQGVIVQ